MRRRPALVDDGPDGRDGLDVPETPNDLELMRRIQAGDEDAFALFVSRHQRRLYRLAFASLGNREDALDATQEAFVRIYRARHRWRPEASPLTWICRILINHCIDRARRRRVRSAVITDEGGVEHIAAPADSGDPAHARLQRAERLERISAAVRRLPERQRAVVILRHSADLSLQEIATALGCSVGTVKSTLHRAIARLRVMLEAANESGA